MENTFEKLKNTILKLGNSNFPKVDNSFSTKMKLETVNTMLLLEENNKISKITMSFFPHYDSNYLAFRIEKENQNFKLIGETTKTDVIIPDMEHKQGIMEIFEKEIENIIINNN